MQTRIRLGLATAAAVTLAALTLRRYTEDTAVIVQAWLLVALLAATTVALRRLRLPAAAVLAGQLLALGVAAAGAAVVVAGGDGPATLQQVWFSALEHVRTQAAPMTPDPAVRLVLLGVVAILLVVTDLIVAGLRRPAWGAAGLAVAGLVPTLVVGDGGRGAAFVCVSVAAMLILAAEGADHADRWTRGLSRDTGTGGGRLLPMVGRAAVPLTVAGLAAAIVVAAVLPTLPTTGPGGGFGVGGRAGAQLRDPALDLRRNLRQPTDRVVIEYRTDQPGGTYLRMASLSVFDAAGWRTGPNRLKPGLTLPAVPGLDQVATPPRRTTLKVLGFTSAYLPLPYAPRRVDIAGDWSHDPLSLVAVADGGPGRDGISNTAYTVDSVDITPTAAELAGAVPGTPADANLTAAVPADLPASLRDLTRQVTAGADTAAEQAAAIQAYLRSDRFTYSTEPLPGSGYQALENFLLNDRRGYCEQFATSMAMMTRLSGIPTRVAVGFLPGTRDGDTWRVRIRNLHAWPELYFARYGWIRFEPTPAAVTGTPPEWTIPRSPSENQPSRAPSAEPSLTAPSSTTVPVDPTTGGPPADATGPGLTWQGVLTAAAGTALLGALLTAPALLRYRRRRLRLSTQLPTIERPEAAWAEIRDTIIDHGQAWPPGTPRSIGATLGHRLGQPHPLATLASMVEQARYAPTYTDHPATRQLPQLIHDIRRSIAGHTSRPRRILAAVFPRSLTRRSPPHHARPTRSRVSRSRRTGRTISP